MSQGFVNSQNITLPLAVTQGGTGLSSTTINQILYSSSANTIAGLATGNSGVLITSAGGVPSISSTLPSGIAATNMALTTPTLGVASATSISFGGSTLSTYTEYSTWTPVLTFATPGNLSVSYATQAGFYSRIGNIVHCSFQLTCTPTFTSASGGMQITGVPATSHNSTGNKCVFPVALSGNASQPGATNGAVIVLDSNAAILQVFGNSPGFSAFQASNFTTAVQIVLYGCFTFLV
jgi:hypothetical protein